MNLKIFKFFILLFLFLSCSSDIDFDQVDDIEFRQEIVSSVLFFEVDQSKFLNTQGTIEINEISDRSILDIFSAIYIQERLIKAEFNIQYQNTFNREFEVDIEFLDASDQITQKRTFIINQNSNNEVEFTFEGNDLIELKRSFHIRLNIRLLPSSSTLDLNQNMKLTLNSIGTFTLVYND